MTDLHKTPEFWEEIKCNYIARGKDLAALGSDFPEHLKNVAPDKEDKLPQVIIAVAEYQYQKQFAIDPLVTLLACVLKIQQILK